MIKMTIVDAEVSTHEKFADLMLYYGGKGYKYAYRHEDHDMMMFLFEERIEFDEYYDTMNDAIRLFKDMKKGHSTVLQIDGVEFVLLKED